MWITLQVLIVCRRRSRLLHRDHRPGVAPIVIFARSRYAASFAFGEITVTTGSCGHALGGVWFHLNIAGGLFYSGDFSMESALFHFDTPPPAGGAADASYGLYDVAQSAQWDKLQTLFSLPTLCPVPPSGRAVELAMLLQDRGIPILRWMPLPTCSGRWWNTTMAACDSAQRSCAVYSDFRHFLQAHVVVADPDGQSGMAVAARAQRFSPPVRCLRPP
jgi:hypothetical protein